MLYHNALVEEDGDKALTFSMKTYADKTYKSKKVNKLLDVDKKNGIICLDPFENVDECEIYQPVSQICYDSAN